MPSIKDMKDKMPKTGVSDAEIEAIAEKHGVDPDLLKISAPYLGGRDYTKPLSGETAAEALATSVGKVGDMATFGFGKDAAIYAAGKADPKMGEAMGELRELADEQEPELMGYGTSLTGGLRGLARKGFNSALSYMKDDKDKKKGSFGDTYGGGRKDYSSEIPKLRKNMTQKEKDDRAAEVSNRIADRKELAAKKEELTNARRDKDMLKQDGVYAPSKEKPVTDSGVGEKALEMKRQQQLETLNNDEVRSREFDKKFNNMNSEQQNQLIDALIKKLERK